MLHPGVRNACSLILLLSLAFNIAARGPHAQQSPQVDSWKKEAMSKLETELIAKYGPSQRDRIQRGLKQVSDFWRTEDGTREVFEDFVRTNFAGDQATLDQMFARMADIYEVDTRAAIRKFTALFEPLIILVMGIIVGVLILSMLLAITSINDVAV